MPAMEDMPPTDTRRYRGAAAHDRRSERRCKLLRAAIQVYGERGYQRATVKAVCEAAGLTERYFYESFANSEALLAASYELVTQSLFEQMSLAARSAGRGRDARVRALLLAYFSALQREPQWARVFLVEIRGVSPQVDAAFEASLRRFGQGLSQLLAPDAEAVDDLLEAGVVGGVIQIALRWIAQG